MRPTFLTALVSLTAALILTSLPADAGQPAKADRRNRNGYLELECNLAGVDLRLCPLDQFERRKVSKFFGLFTSYKESCTGEELSLGATPLQPIELPAGRYVVLIPPGYALGQDDPIEVSIATRQKTFRMLKLFKRYRTEGGGGPDDAGSAPSGSGGGGSGTGGAVGGTPP